MGETKASQAASSAMSSSIDLKVIMYNVFDDEYQHFPAIILVIR